MGGREANLKLEEHVKLPRERKIGRLPAVRKHGKPDSESGLVNRQAPVQRHPTSLFAMITLTLVKHGLTTI